ncbi:DUF72 domain-containing protein [Falsiroseomonas bella]|uniref:DUF72 domain-containing protein n=1 Tax=Falsiroseomonas bella TaxID=2184016 RepID=A0A317FEG9_9PROT|nr:DUF72 domain-containing protein [Falsiroseomonas bella]PWS37471.1 DUF72 domain-containing protein [Falsiroseomonas bella]
MAKRAGRIRAGIAGWVFPPWRGSFYPKGLKQKDELGFAARAFTTLEVNGTFYSMQRPETFAAWDAETPEDFVFTLKGPRYITHMKRLKDCELPLANFLASGVLRLGKKLGPILWQLPPNMAFEAERLEGFLALLPHDRAAAAKLAAQHEPRMQGRAWLDPGPKAPLRHAIEPRHPSFADPACVALCRKHGVALAITDGIPDWPQFRELTADFAYLRLHLSDTQVAGYDAAAIAAWAKQAKACAKAGQDVFILFDAAGDETVKVHTPANASAMLQALAAAG